MSEMKIEHIQELTATLNQMTELSELIRYIADVSNRWTGADAATLMMTNPQTLRSIRTVYRKQESDEPKQMHLARQVISGWIFKNQKQLHSVDISLDEQFTGMAWDQVPFRAVLGMPVVHGGRLGGALICMREAAVEFDETAQINLKTLAGLIAPYVQTNADIEKLFQNRLPDAELMTRYRALGLLGRSQAFVEMLRAVESASKCDVRVLLEGASGTGKERVARAIHHFSRRHSGPFVAIDCGALPVQLIESELFGYVRGAFTGAHKDRRGLIAEANGGTLFLDEVANLPLDIQAKLLRVLQEGELRPVGSNILQSVDVRIIAAASTSLRERMEEGTFREDLYFRLHVYPIAIPPLSERQEDIPLLAHHFMREFSRHQNKVLESIDSVLLNRLQSKKWRGNIRELENLMERFVTLADIGDKLLSQAVLPDAVIEELGLGKSDEEWATIHQQLAQEEKRILLNALSSSDWNQTRAAALLGITEQVMRYRMKRLNITRPRA